MCRERLCEHRVLERGCRVAIGAPFFRALSPPPSLSESPRSAPARAHLRTMTLLKGCHFW